MSYRCEDCGNNPVPHSILFISQTTSYIVSGFSFGRKTSLNNHKLADFVERFLEAIKIICWRNPTTFQSQRTKVIVTSAIKNKVVLQQKFVFNKPTDEFRYFKGSNWVEFYSLPNNNYLPNNLRNRLDNKWQTKKILNDIGARTPKGYVVTTKKQLDSILPKLKFPVVIKPAQGSRGRHSHIFLNTPDQVLKAYKNAKLICGFVICEEMIEGSVYRFTTVNGKVEGVLRGDYPEVIGNGKKSIKQLIVQKNNTKAPEVSKIEPNDYLNSLLVRQNFNYSSIPKKGEIVLLGQKIGINYGGDAVEVSDKIDRSFVSEIEKIAKQIPLLVLGFDVIINKKTGDLNNTKWGIIEINTIPFIDLHHYPRKGRSVNIADKIWENLI